MHYIVSALYGFLANNSDDSSLGACFNYGFGIGAMFAGWLVAMEVVAVIRTAEAIRAGILGYIVISTADFDAVEGCS